MITGGMKVKVDGEIGIDTQQSMGRDQEKPKHTQYASHRYAA